MPLSGDLSAACGRLTSIERTSCNGMEGCGPATAAADDDHVEPSLHWQPRSQRLAGGPEVGVQVRWSPRTIALIAWQLSGGKIPWSQSASHKNAAWSGRQHLRAPRRCGVMVPSPNRLQRSCCDDRLHPPCPRLMPIVICSPDAAYVLQAARDELLGTTSPRRARRHSLQ